MARQKKPVVSNEKKETGKTQVAISNRLIKMMDHVCAETKESRPDLADRLLESVLSQEWEKVKREMGL